MIDGAKALGAQVFLMPGNNFAIAPFFVWPAQAVLTWRAVRIHAMVQRLAGETRIEGYALYFTALVAKGRLDRYLAAGD